MTRRICGAARHAMYLAAVLTLGLAGTSCHHHDDREPVLPPQVEAAPNTLAGVITNISGDPVSGATVTLGDKSATTDANGAYVITGVAQGNHTVSASANGMFTATASVNFTQANHQNLLWSVTLNKKETQTLTVTNAANDATGDIESDNIPNNEEGAVNITVNVPANTVPDNTTISITPIYTEGDATGTRADESTMLIGATVSCSDPNLNLQNPIDVVFSLDSSVVTSVTAKEYDPATGNWRDVTPTIDGNGNVVIKTTRFTSFGIFLPVSVTTTTTSEEITFAQDLFDNRNGNRTMHVDAASFNFKSGTRINVNSRNKLEGLLIEYMARMFGAKVSEMTGTYPLNVDLAVGQGIQLKGSQAVDALSVSSGRTTVTGTRYGNVTVNVQSFSVDHNGGVVGQ